MRINKLVYARISVGSDIVQAFQLHY